MKKIFIPILILAALAVGSCKSKENKSNSKEKPPASVDIIIASQEEFSNDIEVNGTVLSNEMVELHPEVSGRLVYLNIADGANVKEGTILARINDADLQAQLEQQQNQLELATKTEQRLKSLLAVNGVNQADYDAALTQLSSLKAAVKILNAQIDKTIIKAPFSGELGLRMVSPGAYITPQTVICTLQQTEQLKVDFTVPEQYSYLVSKGKQINIQAGDDKAFQTAIILAIEPRINTATRNLMVRAILKNSKLNPGAFVKVVFNEKQKGIVVPSNAIIPEAISNQVILIKNGKAIFKNVETGVRTENIVEIKKGIEPGDSVVVSGVMFVRPDAQVKIRKVRKASDGK